MSPFSIRVTLMRSDAYSFCSFCWEAAGSTLFCLRRQDQLSWMYLVWVRTIEPSFKPSVSIPEYHLRSWSLVSSEFLEMCAFGSSTSALVGAQASLKIEDTVT